jgi:hypothetical protein
MRLKAVILEDGAWQSTRPLEIMSKRKAKGAKPRLSPTNTVAHLTDDLIEGLDLPKLPEGIPVRLAAAIRRRAQAYLFALKEAKKEQYVRVLEIRLIRDAHRAVLTAYELGIQDAEVFYAEFRQLVEELGYERTDIGFKRLER